MLLGQGLGTWIKSEPADRIGGPLVDPFLRAVSCIHCAIAVPMPRPRYSGWTAASPRSPPDTSAYAGWEPLARCRDRVTRAVRGILAAHSTDNVVLVGHGTAWTLLVSELTGQPPDLTAWRNLRMPDVLALEP